MLVPRLDDFVVSQVSKARPGAPKFVESITNSRGRGTRLWRFERLVNAWAAGDYHPRAVHSPVDAKSRRQGTVSSSSRVEPRLPSRPPRASAPRKRDRRSRRMAAPSNPLCSFRSQSLIGPRVHSSKKEQSVEFEDRALKCVDCGTSFVFTAGEHLFFHDKQFKNDPKRCKVCKTKRLRGRSRRRQETRTACAQCGAETTVPFKPTQGRPVLCRSCFQQQGTHAPEAAVPSAAGSVD